MTDDIGERVARAIYEAKPFMGLPDNASAYDGLSEYSKDNLRLRADAALSACGYAEMREALEKTVECLQYIRLGNMIRWRNSRSETEEMAFETEEYARAALLKARGGT